MDNLENNLPTQSQPQPLPTQYDSLRHLVVSILVLVIVISGTLNVFFLRQAGAARQELDAIRPQVNAMMGQYQKNVGPAMEDFVGKLTEFAEATPTSRPSSTGISRRPEPQPGPGPGGQREQEVSLSLPQRS